MKLLSIKLFIVLCFTSLSIFTNAQDWGAIRLNITSSDRGSNCHDPDRWYNFSYRISYPEDIDTDNIREYYRVIQPNNPPYATRVRDMNGRSSLRNSGVPQMTLEYGAGTTGNFEVYYADSWQEQDIVLRLTTLVEYVRIGKNSDGSETVLSRRQQGFVRNFTFELGDYIQPPSPILINGVLLSEFEVDVMNDCAVYTLSSTLSAGADRHEWSLPNANWLVSAPSSINTATIQIKPTFAGTYQEGINDISDISFNAIQSCHTTRIKRVVLPTTLKFPVIGYLGNKMCANGNPKVLEIPPFSSNTTVYWQYDQSKLDEISGQSTNRLEVLVSRNHRKYTTVNLEITNTCGSATIEREFWLGTPSMPLTNPSGLPAVRMPYLSSRDYFVVNHDNGQGGYDYEWTVSGLGTQLYGNGLGCTVWANQRGTFNYRVRRENVCGWSPRWVGTINVPSSNNGGGGNGGGGGSGGGAGVQYRTGIVNTTMDALEEPTIKMDDLDGISIKAISLQVYPNPVSDQLQWQFIDHKGGMVDLSSIEGKIFDINGKVVLQTKGNSADVSELATGGYILQFMLGNEMISHQFLVK